MSGAASPPPPLPPGAAMRWEIVRNWLPLDPGDILEIGCGQGGFAARLARYGRSFVGLEPDPDSFAIARARVEPSPRAKLLNSRSDELPSEQKFDTICAFEVIEHLEDDRTALAEWVSRLRPGGTLLISVPAHSDRLGPWDELGGHFRRYDPDQMVTMLERAGLRDVRFRLYGYPLGPLLEKIRNVIARRQLASRGLTVQQRTNSSGRQLQPKDGTAARIMQAAVLPFAKLQHLFPRHGVALIASGTLPAGRP